jgi:putative component of toxin-antitoxin plasmid stabilization module
MPYELEFFEENGREPVRDWLDGLTEHKRAAAMRALSIVLADQGIGVAQSEFGKALGGGLYEFRIRHSAQEIVEKFRPGMTARLGPFPDDVVLLRVFFHPHGDQLILLLAAYDKGADPSEKRQQRQIEIARKRLHAWRQANRGGLADLRPFRHWWIAQVRRR